MKSIAKERQLKRIRRKKQIRKKINGTLERPRLVVYRSLNEIYAQIVDDVQGKTLFAANSLMKELKPLFAGKKGKIAKSEVVGEYIAKKALDRGIESVVFDRGGYKYHGRVKAVAEAARKAGLKL